MKRFVIFALLSSVVAGSAQAQRMVPPAAIPDVGISNRVQNIQSNESHRVIELEETIRSLNGKVEELNFLLLQLQEKLRKLEEENEGRFQELEEHHSSASDKSQDVAVATPPKTEAGEQSLGKPDTSAAPSADVKEESQAKIVGPEPRALGTLTFDKDGNVVDETGSSSVIAENPFGNGTDGSVEASQFGATPSEVFTVGKKALGARQYPKAQKVFSAYLTAWPKDPNKGEARYYLGEALFWQKAYFQSAEMHLETHNEFPEADTAADNLLGLGLSLAGLNQREVACATYAEVLKQYPDSASRLSERVKDEQAAARC